MRKSCSYCGRIHDSKQICMQKQKSIDSRNKKKRVEEKNLFRNSQAWADKRNEMRNRDNNLCQVCIRLKYETINQYTYDNLSVHHAVPLEEDFDKRLDNDNLLTLCDRHHSMAEDGRIPRSYIFKIIREQEEKVQDIGI